MKNMIPTNSGLYKKSTCLSLHVSHQNRSPKNLSSRTDFGRKSGPPGPLLLPKSVRLDVWLLCFESLNYNLANIINHLFQLQRSGKLSLTPSQVRDRTKCIRSFHQTLQNGRLQSLIDKCPVTKGLATQDYSGSGHKGSLVHPTSW